MDAVPSFIVTPRLQLSSWKASDAEELSETLNLGSEHLKKWLPWAQNEPISVKDRREILMRFENDFKIGKDFLFSIRHHKYGPILGGVGLHPRVERPHEIGYWLASTALGKGIATEAAAALVRIGFELLGLKEIEMRCHPKNLASNAIPYRLGFKMKRELNDAQGLPILFIWELNLEGYARFLRSYENGFRI